ncbi:hypothetical protein [Pseudonocardia halophobica]|nr:hypothetical protein [Pseudonocardia halophobica]
MRMIAMGAAGLSAVLLAIALMLSIVLGTIGPVLSDQNGSGLEGPAPAQPFRGSSAGCTEDDPTTRGCLTPATLNALNAVLATFGPTGRAIRAVSCWDPHLQNPSSDHPKGRACDIFPTTAGTFPVGDQLAHGWQIANWLRTNAASLHVHYLIWQGRYWDITTADENGWGVPYNGGGIYNVSDPTGGHYDHIHLSVAD